MNKEIISKLELIKGTVRTSLPQLCKKNNTSIVSYILTLLEELENLIKNEYIE